MHQDEMNADIIKDPDGSNWSSVIFSLFFLAKVEPPVSEVERCVGPHPQHRHLPGQRHVEDVLHAQPAILRGKPTGASIGNLVFREHRARALSRLPGVPRPGLGIDLK